MVLEHLKKSLPHWARTCKLTLRSLASALTRDKMTMERLQALAPGIPSCLNLNHELDVNKGGMECYEKQSSA